jgi:predicted transcriptional regulator
MSPEGLEMERPKADSFTAFLEAQQRLQSSEQSVVDITPLTLLFKLAEAPNLKMPVTELMAASGMSFTDFAEALKSLNESGYVTLAGPPSNEVASLTKLGEGASHLARAK